LVRGRRLHATPIHHGSIALAYDLYAFDLFAAPRDRYDFLDWVSRTFRDADGESGGDVSRTTAPLRAWHRDMSQGFPGRRDPHALDEDDTAAQRTATYRFRQGIVQASFHWEASGQALFRGRKFAQVHGAGLFEASGNDGAVWMLSQRGRFEVVHRSDDARRA
jgi:hypothetical protein